MHRLAGTTLVGVLLAGVAGAAIPPAGAAEGAERHVVRRGESLSVIAARYGVSLEELVRENDVADPHYVRRGRELRIPGERTSHVVAPGESLSQIARSYGVSVLAITLANDVPNPDLVWAGTTLTIPDPRKPAAPIGPVPASRAHHQPAFLRYAEEAGVPADLLMAVAWQESGWQEQVVSSAGARGVMQLMPATVDFVSIFRLRRSAPLDPRDPEQNIRMGAHFLRYLLDETQDTRLALVAYNQGLGALNRDGPYEDSLRFAENVLALRGRF